MNVVLDASVTLAWYFEDTLTLSDAAYRELAHRRALPLATLDRAMQAAAQDLALGVA